MRKRAFYKSGILFFIVLLYSISYADDINSVISFYLNNLDYVFNQNYAFKSDSSFSCKAQSIMSTTDYRGKPDKTDTTVVKLFYSKGQLDSSAVLDSAKLKDNILPDSFVPPQIWRDSLKYDFYPNDTGAGTLAIGFESKSMDSSKAVIGFLNLNRANFYLEALFLHYPHPENYGSISEIYIFDSSDGHLLLRRFERQTSKILFMGRQYSKQTVDFSDFRFE
jgi:hypothetical protein